MDDLFYKDLSTIYNKEKKMRTVCKILTYNLEDTPLSQIEKDIEGYCNESFFTFKAVKTLSCVTLDDSFEENYIVNVVYEIELKWLRILLFMALIALTITLIYSVSKF